MRKLLIVSTCVCVLMLALLWIDGRRDATPVKNRMAEGNVAYEAGDYETALAAYREGILEDPRHVEIKFNYEWVEKLIEDQQQDKEDNQQQEQEDQDGQNQEDSQNSDQQDENQGEDGQSDKSQSDQDESEEASENSESQEASESKPENSSVADEEAIDPQDAEVQQILRILEEEEAESLKNNQSLQEGKAGEGNDW